MSTKAKGVNIQKVIDQFQKADLDEQVKAFAELKTYLTEKLLAKEQELENQREKYISIKESINK